MSEEPNLLSMSLP